MVFFAKITILTARGHAIVEIEPYIYRMKILKNHSFEGQVWKVIFDIEPTADSSQKLCLETRNNADKTVKWLVLDGVSGEIIWQKEAADWWESLASFQRGCILIKQFSNAQEPAPRGSFLLNMADGELLHQPPVETTDNIVPIYFQYPGTYIATDLYYKTMAQFINQVSNHAPVEAVEYAELNGHVVLSYYYYAENLLNQAILVIDRNRQIVFSEPLANNLTGLTAVSFLISDKNLYFVKNKNEFVLINFD